jgi:hypothetical protein
MYGEQPYAGAPFATEGETGGEAETLRIAWRRRVWQWMEPVFEYFW